MLSITIVTLLFCRRTIIDLTVYFNNYQMQIILAVIAKVLQNIANSLSVIPFKDGRETFMEIT